MQTRLAVSECRKVEGRASTSIMSHSVYNHLLPHKFTSHHARAIWVHVARTRHTLKHGRQINHFPLCSFSVTCHCCCQQPHDLRYPTTARRIRLPCRNCQMSCLSIRLGWQRMKSCALAQLYEVARKQSPLQVRICCRLCVAGCRPLFKRPASVNSTSSNLKKGEMMSILKLDCQLLCRALKL